MNIRGRHSIIVILALGILLLGVPGAAGAATRQRCFPETGYCITGRIREFWEQNGGLPTFGFPITPQQPELIGGQQFQIQWFERARLELHPKNRRPYDVLLGRLGADVLLQQRSAALPAPRAAPQDGCRFFAETGQNACGEILSAWRASGLELDGRPGKSEAESLALFGLPLTNLRPETLSDGRQYMTQWFERGRFELHPENPPHARVLLGLLGRESAPVVRAASPVTIGAPARLSIPAIDLDQAVVAVGLDSRGAPIVPDHDIGWYNQSAMPGQGENIVFWGHVLRFRNAPRIPAPFARLKQLQLGDRLTLYDGAGNARSYVVTRQVWAKPYEVEYILPQGSERVTLVSCIGDQVVSDGEVVDMSHRLITIAEPA